MREACRWLVLAPHADDEVLGCGGTLALATARGAEVRVIVAFDGAAGDPLGRFDPAHYVARREQEARRGGAHLGIHDYQFWGLPEGHRPSDAELSVYVPALARAVRDYAPEVLLAPWPGESHGDHASLARVVELWMGAEAPPCPVWGYEVWSALEPELMVEVAAVWPAKQRALREHATQLAYRDLLSSSDEAATRRGGLHHEAFRRLDDKSPQAMQREVQR